MSTTVTENQSESKITVQLVKRVSRRVAMGIPLHISLGGEPVNLAEYEAELRRCPELAAIQARAKRKFLERALGMILCGKNARSNVGWWLRRVYPRKFLELKEDGLL